jgi:hypothetical protein
MHAIGSSFVNNLFDDSADLTAVGQDIPFVRKKVNVT